LLISYDLNFYFVSVITVLHVMHASRQLKTLNMAYLKHFTKALYLWLSNRSKERCLKTVG